jgi:hypothetical protein
MGFFLWIFLWQGMSATWVETVESTQGYLSIMLVYQTALMLNVVVERNGRGNGNGMHETKARR